MIQTIARLAPRGLHLTLAAVLINPLQVGFVIDPLRLPEVARAR